jgi:hypothetical protein
MVGAAVSVGITVMVGAVVAVREAGTAGGWGVPHELKISATKTRFNRSDDSLLLFIVFSSLNYER